MRKLFFGLIAAGVMVAGSAHADAIADRKATMKGVGGAMGTLVRMVRGQADFDAQAALAAFTTMNNATTGFVDLFPEGTETGGKTTVSAKVWEDRAGFEAAVNKFAGDTAAAVAAAPADLDALKAAFGPVAGNCNACHEVYRIPQQ